MVEPNYRFASAPEGVDPRLDNRTGDARPPIETDPAVPQQVDGPDLLGQAEHAEAVQRAQAESSGVPRKGMFSPGDHGLGELDARDRGRGDLDPGQGGGEALETDPGNPGSAPTDATKAAASVLQTPGSAQGSPAAAEGDHPLSVQEGEGKSVEEASAESAATSGTAEAKGQGRGGRGRSGGDK